MKWSHWIATAGLLAGTLGFSLQDATQATEKPAMKLKRMTPILVVDTIEPCLELWVDRLGFKKTAEVPEGDRLWFVMMERDGIELMIQTKASVEKDVPAVAEAIKTTALFIEVEDLEPFRKALAGDRHIFEERKTFYGSTEIAIWTPGGHVVTFAQMDKTDR